MIVIKSYNMYFREFKVCKIENIKKERLRFSLNLEEAKKFESKQAAEEMLKKIKRLGYSDWEIEVIENE